VSCSSCFRRRVELVAHALPSHVLTISAGLTSCGCTNNSNQGDPVRCFTGSAWRKWEGIPLKPDDCLRDQINRFSHNSIKMRSALVRMSEQRCNYKTS
jgi:hypothetical protein